MKRPKAKKRTTRRKLTSSAAPKAPWQKTPRAVRPKRYAGGKVNPRIPLPKPPGPWVDEERNHVTGQRYEDFNAHIDFETGREIVKRAARRAGDRGEGFKSRGPVLHAMRVAKLEAWYRAAMNDGALWNEERGRPFTAAELRGKTTKADRRYERRAARPARTEARRRRWGDYDEPF